VTGWHFARGEAAGPFPHVDEAALTSVDTGRINRWRRRRATRCSVAVVPRSVTLWAVLPRWN